MKSDNHLLSVLIAGACSLVTVSMSAALGMLVGQNMPTVHWHTIFAAVLVAPFVETLLFQHLPFKLLGAWTGERNKHASRRIDALESPKGDFSDLDKGASALVIDSSRGTEFPPPTLWERCSGSMALRLIAMSTPFALAHISQGWGAFIETQVGGALLAFIYIYRSKISTLSAFWTTALTHQFHNILTLALLLHGGTQVLFD